MVPVWSLNLTPDRRLEPDSFINIIVKPGVVVSPTLKNGDSNPQIVYEINKTLFLMLPWTKVKISTWYNVYFYAISEKLRKLPDDFDEDECPSFLELDEDECLELPSRCLLLLLEWCLSLDDELCLLELLECFELLLEPCFELPELCLLELCRSLSLLELELLLWSLSLLELEECLSLLELLLECLSLLELLECLSLSLLELELLWCLSLLEEWRSLSRLELLECLSLSRLELLWLQKTKQQLNQYATDLILAWQEFYKMYIYGLVQDCSISSALTME